MLSDDVLLEIFDFCRKNQDWEACDLLESFSGVWGWHILVHVCQKWRQVVYASPLRLDLQLLCTHVTPVRKNLDIWPTLPISIVYHRPDPYSNNGFEEDVVAALEQHDRVSTVELQGVTCPQLRKIIIVMQEPFPALTFLELSDDVLSDDAWSDDGSNVPLPVPCPVLPSEFLGGSAPCLQTIFLDGIPFPALPRLLLSTSNLVSLCLSNIPQTGYIPPEDMVLALATLTRLGGLQIGFQSPSSRPSRICLPPVTRTVLPALTNFTFLGVREYLEDFIARIDTPQLTEVFTRFFNQLIDFEVPQLCQFIERSDLDRPMRRCSLEFDKKNVGFVAGRSHTHHFPPFKPSTYLPRCMYVGTQCEGIDWQVSQISRALDHLSPVLSNVAHIKIDFSSSSLELEDMDDIEWLQLLHPFSSVQTLIVSGPFSGHVSHALEDSSGGMGAEVLPALEMLCLEGQPVSSFHKFIAARSESGRPVTTIDTREEFEERLRSYQNY